jgi:hypothetical protein
MAALKSRDPSVTGRASNPSHSVKLVSTQAASSGDGAAGLTPEVAGSSPVAPVSKSACNSAVYVARTAGAGIAAALRDVALKESAYHCIEGMSRGLFRIFVPAPSLFLFAAFGEEIVMSPSDAAVGVVRPAVAGLSPGGTGRVASYAALPQAHGGGSSSIRKTGGSASGVTSVA